MPLYNPSTSATATRQWPWQASDNNFLGADFDPLLTDSTGDLLNNGQICLSKTWLPASVTVANLIVIVTAVGTSLTAGQNWGGLFSSTGTLLAKTADQSTPWATTGVKTMALTVEAGQSLTQGGSGVYVYGALLVNAVGSYRFARARAQAATSLANQGLTSLNHRFGDSGSGQTTLPASIASTGTTSGHTLWMALT